MSLAPTLSLTDAARRCWSVIVVGGGPAGALASYLLARAGAAVLLIDQASFPRGKVCGACLNGAALASLAAAGLGELPAAAGAIPLRQFLVSVGGRRVPLPLRDSMALSRAQLDARLVAAALGAGAQFLPQTRLQQLDLGPERRTLTVLGSETRTELSARMVLVATGLARSWSMAAIADRDRRAQVRPPNCVQRALRWLTGNDSRIGAGTSVAGGDRFYEPGTIYMAVGRAGYVGAVRVEDGQLNVAAALDLEGVRAAGGPGMLAVRIMEAAGLPAVDGLAAAPWRGTPALTAFPASVAEPRLFLLGDAAGYVEPFTGEGIAWALAAARAVVPLTLAAADAWRDDYGAAWTSQYRACVARRQRLCRLVAAGLRRPRLVQGLVATLGCLPALADPILRRINNPHVHLQGMAR